MSERQITKLEWDAGLLLFSTRIQLAVLDFEETILKVSRISIPLLGYLNVKDDV